MGLGGLESINQQQMNANVQPDQMFRIGLPDLQQHEQMTGGDMQKIYGGADPAANAPKSDEPERKRGLLGFWRTKPKQSADAQELFPDEDR